MSNADITRLPRRDLRGRNLPLLRGLLPIVLALAILWLLRDRLAGFDLDAVIATTQQFVVLQWGGAAALSALSFYAIAQYDRLVAAQMGLDLPRKQALGAGWRATAVSQVLGYGLVTGALTRWRALGRATGLSLWDCSRLTAGVTACFFAGWAAVTALSVLIMPLPSLQGWPTALAGLGVGVTLVLVVTSFLASGRWAHLVPAPRFILPVIGFTALDTLAACAVIYVFLPAGYMPFHLLHVAFLIALTAGMISGLPGGIGAFELCLIGLLAPADPAPLLAAILGFRMVYYALPAALAAVTLLVQRPNSPTQIGALANTGAPCLADTPPEAGLTAQNLLQIHPSPDQKNAVLWHRSRNCDIVLGAPFRVADASGFITALASNAGRAGRGLCLYKCDANTAQTAQSLGFITFKIGSEAIVKPTEFTTKGAPFRQLRRKLRQAEKAHVTLSKTQPTYPVLAQIDAAWQAECGPARGFSMGRLTPQLLARQHLFVAQKDGRPIGFLTCLVGPRSWTLDVMRIPSTCPDGTAHMLVAAAIDAARDAGIDTLSLAAAPFYLPRADRSVAAMLVTAMFRRSPQLKGLAQFKNCFAPDWQPRYIAASNGLTLCYAPLDLWRLIRHPPPECPDIMRAAHKGYGVYEFASRLWSCHALQRMTSKDPPHEHLRQRPFQAPRQ